MTELYKKYRPTILKRVYGQESAISVLTPMLRENRIPHFCLFTGPSGCGKTTLARIVAAKLKCGEADMKEINAADFRGVDAVRDIRKTMGLRPIAGETRIWIIDEAHQLTSAAQNLFLKLLEDTPNHVYFLFATTDPQKLLPTVRTRATQIKVESLGPQACKDMLDFVCTSEKIKIAESVQEKLFEVGEASPRKILVLLDQIRSIKGEEEQLDSIQKSDLKPKAIELAKILMNQKAAWPTIAKIVKECEDEPEGIRRLVLAFATNNLLSNRNPDRNFVIIEAFRDDFFDSGKAKLAAACFEVYSMNN